MSDKTHIYPSEDRPSMLEMTTPGVVVREPLRECWLCQRGRCLQTEAQGVVVHSPNSDARPPTWDMAKALSAEQRHYRLLDDWVIRYEDDGKHYAEVTCHVGEKVATVRPPDDSVDDIGTYVSHEILHVAFAALRRAPDRHEAEELLVQDLVLVMQAAHRARP